MPNQFVVPQFIDAVDKILVPITVRQFVIVLVTGLLVAVFYRLFDFSLFLLLGVPTFAVGVLLAFMKVNGVPVHFFLINLIQTVRRPFLRVWDKSIPDEVLRARLAKPELAPPPTFTPKGPLNGSRLDELSLLVNTGGAYRPEEDVYGQT